MEEEWKEHHEKKKRNVIQFVVMGLVVALLIFAGIQTFQINGLEKRVAQDIAPVSGQQRGIAPADIKRIAAQPVPTMVGGC